MGRSDPYILPFYRENIKPEGQVALLGFTDNRYFAGDLYDLQLNNWEINSDWNLDKKYDTIISLRCPYFAKDPEDFIKRCYDHLNEGGKLYVDWGLGDHFRFENYKVGWAKNGEQEYAYKDDNFLWSTVWDDSFLKDEQFKLFSKRVQKYHYGDIKKAIFEEVPKVMYLEDVNKYFNISYNIRALWGTSFLNSPQVLPEPQVYILIKGIKNTRD